jgi:hypothetical protein
MKSNCPQYIQVSVQPTPFPYHAILPPCKTQPQPEMFSSAPVCRSLFSLPAEILLMMHAYTVSNIAFPSRINIAYHRRKHLASSQEISRLNTHALDLLPRSRISQSYDLPGTCPVPPISDTTHRHRRFASHIHPCLPYTDDLQEKTRPSSTPCSNTSAPEPT